MTHLARKHLALPALALAAALGSCGDKQVNSAPPLDRLFFPTGLALRHVDALGATCDPAVASGCRTQLLVASSNFDLSFGTVEGGTVAVIDAEAAVAAAKASGAPSPLPLTGPDAQGVLVGTPARIGSFAGELAVLDETTCPGWETRLGRAPQALVASRSQTALYRVDLASGGPTCQGCALPLDATLADPYGVTVACGSFPAGDLGVPSPRSFAFVTFLRSPASVGFVTRVDLEADPAASETLFSLDVVPTHSSIFDPASTRLYVTARYNGVGAFAPLRYMALARPDPGEFTKVDLSPFLRGAEPQGAALSSDRSRIFLGLRVYDPDEAARIGVRPIADLAGALVVLDAADSASGQLPAAPIAILPIDHGPTVVRTLPRAGKRDLVFITANDDSSLIVYDDETGAIAQELTLCDPGTLSTAAQPSPADPLAPFPCPAGRARLGAQPFGLAVEPRAPTAEFPELPNGFARLYVGSFDRSWVNVIDLDPEHPQKAPQPQHWWRIGQERP